MNRTQVQLPDELYTAARKLAARKEISLAELIRRGLEYMLSVSPDLEREPEWKPPKPVRMGTSVDPFADPEWRMKIHMERLQVAEERAKYGGGSDKRKK